VIPNLQKLQGENIYWVGVDKGVSYLLEKNIKPMKAFGDFDSVSERELLNMKKELPDLEVFPSEKDETDTEIAVKWAITQNPDKIKLFGVTGGRLDHFFGNIQLLLKGMEEGVRIEVHDIQNELFLVKEGCRSLARKQDFPYISFIPITPEVKGITLKGFKYPLENRNIKWGDTLCISNELDFESGTFSYVEGILMVIRSRDYYPLF
jgi:thiamine pyrophosphokinase